MNFSFVGLTETWLSDSTANCYSIDNYENVNNFRHVRRGGGVSILVKNGIDYFRRNELEVFTVDVESVFIEVNKNVVHSDKNVIIGVIYRPPNTNLDNFLLYIDDLLDRLSKENKFCYLLGDYNLNILNCDKHDKTSQFIDTMFSYHFAPLINKPTRIREKSATLIDNIFTNNFETKSIQGIFYTDITDHFLVFYGCKSLSTQSTDQFVTKRMYHNDNVSRFVNILQSSNWEDVTGSTDPQHAFSCFHKKFHDAYLQAFPMKTIKLTYINRKPWLTKGLKASIKYKNNLYAKYKRFPTKNMELIYRKYNKRLSGILFKAERDHYDKLFDSYKSNMRKSWQLIAKIINKNSRSRRKPTFTGETGLPLSDKQVANNFNNFFVNVGPSLAQKIPNNNVDQLSYMSTRNTHSILLKQVESGENSKEMKNASPGWDEIHAKIIKNTYLTFIGPLTHVCNLSILKGCFPSELKLAKVVPIFKADCPSTYTNYRPVSVLPCFSKILETLMYDRLISFVIQNELLYKYQFGFRKLHSTILAIITLTDMVAKALENGDHVIGVFLGFSKAFDTL